MQATQQLLASAPPAGGAGIGEVIGATLAVGIVFALLMRLVTRHRAGRTQLLVRASAKAEEITGLPGWASLPIALATVSLLSAAFGVYWDISLHIDQGRDPGPLANPAHYFILAGLFGIMAAGVLAVFLPVGERPGPAAVRITGNWYAPVGGILIAVCGAFGLLGFPLDDLWHRLFGQDVTLWGPTHLVMISGAVMTIIGQAVLVSEGMAERRRRAEPTEEIPLITRVRRVMLMGALLVGLSVYQAEFDFGVPQYRLVFQPMLIALAAGVVLVAARVWIGRGGALGALGLFLLIRGTISLLVGPILGETTPHFPLYVAEAAVVELVGLVVTRERPLVLGATGGLLAGTVGFAAEWAWSQEWMTIPWNGEIMPEALIVAAAAGVAGGLIGALLGAGLRGRLPRPPVARAAFIGSVVAVMALVGDGLAITSPSKTTADVTLHETAPPPQREVQATVRFSPRDAADDAIWLNATAWQDGGLVVNALQRQSEGVYRTTEPLPVFGTWKSTIRFHTGRELDAMPIYLPRDPEIPAPEVPARHRFSRSFTADINVLQRERSPDVPGWLWSGAELVVLVLGLGFISALAWGVGRAGRRTAGPEEKAPPRKRGLRSLRPTHA